MKKEYFGLDNCLPHHAYLVKVDMDARKELLDYFIKKLDVSAADTLIISTSDNIKIQDIRILQHFIGLTPHSSRFKLVAIDNAELLTQDAGNALLKTLEEPPKNSILILFTKTTDAIMKTIVSRCRVIKIPKILISRLDIDKEKIYDGIKSMSVKEKFALASEIVKKQETAVFLEGWLIYLRGKISYGRKWQYLAKYIYMMKRNLKFNINQKLMLENILLEAK